MKNKEILIGLCIGILLGFSALAYSYWRSYKIQKDELANQERYWAKRSVLEESLRKKYGSNTKIEID
ncbi:hypothetical protein [Runella limosa]|jgi:CHASE3 domain sensor protein|uniref:hypothetical protein n=1 Tax=Runella limosa TaxID=370978 RepID=UPI00040D5729|nr:hypothetical protein [Runella limosa]